MIPVKAVRRCTLICISLGLIACLCVQSESALAAAPPSPRPPNLVFLLVDDLGWTDLGCYGGDLYQTPNVDRLAGEGTRFTDGYAACNVCSPTRAALMTGMYPARLHLTDYLNGTIRPSARLRIPEWTKHLEHRYVTLAEALKAAGYSTIHAGKWHLAPRPDEGNLAVEDRSFFPDRHGFDVQISGVCAPGSYFHPWRRGGYDAGLADAGHPGEYLTDRLTEEALKAMEAHRERPFFLYLAHFDVHAPIEAKPEYVEKYRPQIRPDLRHRNPAYAAKVQSMDESVGRVMEKLQALGLAENTVIVFTSDNGGLDRGGDPTDNHPLREGKGTNYEGGVRVSTIVKWPGVTRPGSVCHEPVITMDFYPTLLELAHAAGDAKHNAEVDGRSLVPLLKDPAATLHREALYWHYPHYHPCGASPYGAVRSGDWRLVEFYDDMRVELYNLADDLGESKNLADSHPEQTARLRTMLHDWRRSVGAQMPVSNPNHDPVQDAQDKAAQQSRPQPRTKK